MNKHEIIQRLVGCYPLLTTEIHQSIYHELMIKTPDQLCELYNKTVKESKCEYLGGNMYNIIFK
jgi:hypothetical protein